ncbi:hypothetical protein M407DRAFT_13316, partial [Tulasnella calospora MUT 4182]
MAPPGRFHPYDRLSPPKPRPQATWDRRADLEEGELQAGSRKCGICSTSATMARAGKGVAKHLRNGVVPKLSENPMPSVDESIELAGDAYHLAKSDRPHVNPPTHVKHISILRRAIPQVWGKIKDAAWARTGDTYSFDDRPRMGQKNRRLYVSLIEGDAYTCEEPESRKGTYYHPLCYKIIKTCFFSKATDDRVLFPEFFNPIRAKTVALVFTA